MFEPDVTLTDFAVAIECAILVAVLLRGGAWSHATAGWLTVFVAAGGVASFFGGVVHGFVPDNGSLVYGILWRGVMLTLGVTALSLWGAGTSLLKSRTLARGLFGLALVQVAVYAAIILFVNHQFVVGIAVYLPAVLFALAVLLASYARSAERGVAIAIAGLGLTILAAVLQQMQVGVHPIYFNYNALFHTLNGLSMFVIFWAARSLAPAAQASGSRLVGQAVA